MLVYVWSRNFPTANVSIMGLVSVEVHIAAVQAFKVVCSQASLQQPADRLLHVRRAQSGPMHSQQQRNLPGP